MGFKEISELYWEEFWEIGILAANLLAEEENEKRRFEFMIHCQSKEAMESWKDSPIPFPDESKLEKKKVNQFGERWGVKRRVRYVKKQ